MQSKLIALVFGGTHGIGRASVLRLAHDGYHVFFTGRDERAGQSVTRECGRAATYVRGDVKNAEHVEEAVRKAVEAGAGKLHALACVAGMSRRVRFADSTVADWDELFTVNARGVYLAIRYSLEGLIAGRGAVAIVSSIAGRGGEEELSLYSASKAALLGLTQSLALELGDTVRLNAICPGQIATRMMARVTGDPAATAALESRIPAGRLGRADEVADVVAWLLSARASFVNGAIITVDGGETAGLRALNRRGRE